MYTSIVSVCCTPETNIMLRQYLIKRKLIKKSKLKERSRKLATLAYDGDLIHSCFPIVMIDKYSLPTLLSGAMYGQPLEWKGKCVVMRNREILLPSWDIKPEPQSLWGTAISRSQAVVPCPSLPKDMPAIQSCLVILPLFYMRTAGSLVTKSDQQTFRYGVSAEWWSHFHMTESAIVRYIVLYFWELRCVSISLHPYIALAWNWRHKKKGKNGKGRKCTKMFVFI